MSVIDELVTYAQNLKYEDLPSQAVEAVKTQVLDTCGAMMAGSKAEGPKNLVNLLKEWGGRGEGTIFVYGYKVPLPNAAWANSTMSRGFDYETLLSGGATHVSASIVPGAFAIAEYGQVFKDKTISGKDLITAIALGSDLNWRLRVAGGESTIMAGGWLAETFAPPAIAALGGKLLGFDRGKIYHAMGIGYNQCSGTYGACLGENGGLMGQLSQGMGTKAGVLSVVLADRGFTAFKDIIDGRWGLYKIYGRGHYDPDVLVGELGTRFESLNPTIKRYPGCGATQPVIYGVIELVRENNIKAEDVAGVNIGVIDSAYYQCGENKGEPSNTADALWNFRYATAVALVKGKVLVDDFTREAIQNPQVLALVQKVDVYPDKSLTREVEIEIKTKDGKYYRRKESNSNPMLGSEIIEKFRSCNRFSAKPLPEESLQRLIRMINKLEENDDVAQIISMLS